MTNLPVHVHNGDIHMTLCQAAGQTWSEGAESSLRCFGARWSSVGGDGGTCALLRLHTAIYAVQFQGRTPLSSSVSQLYLPLALHVQQRESVTHPPKCFAARWLCLCSSVALAFV